MQAPWHHPISESRPDVDHPSNLLIDHMYCMDFDRWDQDDWDRLYDIYRQLPGNFAEEEGEDRWFEGCEDEERPPYLSASTEPPGLQVSAALPEEVWSDWHERFVEAVERAGLPVRPAPQRQ